MNDVLLVVLLISGFVTVGLSIGLWQDGREIERKKAEKEARRAAAAAAHGGAPA